MPDYQLQNTSVIFSYLIFSYLQLFVLTEDGVYGNWELNNYCLSVTLIMLSLSLLLLFILDVMMKVFDKGLVF